MTRAPSYPQRIALNVLAWGGYMDPGEPGESCPRLYNAENALFAYVHRSTFDVLHRRGWLDPAAGPTGRRRYVASRAGRQISQAFRP